VKYSLIYCLFFSNWLCRFDISSYPHTHDELLANPTWKSLLLANNANASLTPTTKPSFATMVHQLGNKGEKIVDHIFQHNNISSPYCGKALLASNELISTNERSLKKKAFLKQGVSLVALSYHTPQ